MFKRKSVDDMTKKFFITVFSVFALLIAGGVAYDVWQSSKASGEAYNSQVSQFDGSTKNTDTVAADDGVAACVRKPNEGERNSCIIMRAEQEDDPLLCRFMHYEKPDAYPYTAFDWCIHQVMFLRWQNERNVGVPHDPSALHAICNEIADSEREEICRQFVDLNP